MACNIHSCKIEYIIQYIGEVFQITTSALDTHVGTHCERSNQQNDILGLGPLHPKDST